jgi:TrpR-related protein YerC/YecD
MKEHRVLTDRQEIAAEEELFSALLRLKSVAELRAFFQDLCTPAELQAMKDRWLVVELLAAGLTYREIHRRQCDDHWPGGALPECRDRRLQAGTG